MNRNAGYSKRPYGGYKRLDRVDLRDYNGTTKHPIKSLFLHVILDAANDYLFYGLCAKNGTTVQEFYYSYIYFFVVRSNDNIKYEESKKINLRYDKDNKRHNEEIELTKEQYNLMCFDTHFKLSGINMTMTEFLNLLKRRRKEILTNNWDSVNEYYNNITIEGKQLTLPKVDRLKVLVDPDNPEELELLFK